MANLSSKQLEQRAIERTEKSMDSIDRFVVRIWMDGYKQAQIDSGQVTEAVPTATPDHSFNATAPPTPPTPKPASTYEIPTDALPQGWRKVYHNRGEYPCGRPAFLLTRPIYADEASTFELMRFINGNHITINDAPLCGSCQRPVHPYSNADLDWDAHKLPAQRKTYLTFAEENPLHPQRPPAESRPDGFTHGMDPAVTRATPAETLRETYVDINRPYTLPDHDPVHQLITGDELDELQKLQEEIGLPLPPIPNPGDSDD